MSITTKFNNFLIHSSTQKYVLTNNLLSKEKIAPELHKKSYLVIITKK